MIPAHRGNWPWCLPLPSMTGEFGHSPKTSPPACCNGNAAGLVAADGGGARPVADDDADAAELVAGRSGGARPVAGDNAEGPVAGGTGRDAGNAAKDSQTGQSLPLQGGIAGTTRSRMVAKALGTWASSFSSLRQTSA